METGEFRGITVLEYGRDNYTLLRFGGNSDHSESQIIHHADFVSFEPFQEAKTIKV